MKYYVIKNSSNFNVASIYNTEFLDLLEKSSILKDNGYKVQDITNIVESRRIAANSIKKGKKQ